MGSNGGTFSQRLRMFRERAGLTQVELGRRVFLSRSYVSHFEQGRKQPDLEIIERLASALGVTIAELVGERPPEPTVEDQAVRLLRDFVTGVQGVPVLFAGVIPADAMRWVATEGARRTVRVLDVWLSARSSVEFLVVEASGDCLKSSHGILSGNWVLIDRTQRQPANGELALVRIGDDYSLKIWQRSGDTVELLTGDGAVAHRGTLNEQVVVEGTHVTHWPPTAAERAALAAQGSA